MSTRNQTKHFYVYLTNMVQRIRRISEPKQWHCVFTSANTADVGTRSVTVAVVTVPGSRDLLSCYSVTTETETYDCVGPELDDEFRIRLSINVSPATDSGREQLSKEWQTNF